MSTFLGGKACKIRKHKKVAVFSKTFASCCLKSLLSDAKQLAKQGPDIYFSTVLENRPIAAFCSCHISHITPFVPLAIKTIMIVLFKILTLFHFKAIRSSWLTLKEILIVSMAKGTQ